MSTSQKRIDAKLTSTGGDVYPVTLNATIAQLRGAAGIEDEAVGRVELLDRVPDGDYILEYFYGKPFHGRARVVKGSLECL